MAVWSAHEMKNHMTSLQFINLMQYWQYQYEVSCFLWGLKWLNSAIMEFIAYMLQPDQLIHYGWPQIMFEWNHHQTPLECHWTSFHSVKCHKELCWLSLSWICAASVLHSKWSEIQYEAKLQMKTEWIFSMYL